MIKEQNLGIEMFGFFSTLCQQFPFISSVILDMAPPENSTAMSDNNS